MTVTTDRPVEPQELSRDEAYDRVHALARGCTEHAAVRNPFYDLWISKELSADQVEIVAKNFSPGCVVPRSGSPWHSST